MAGSDIVTILLLVALEGLLSADNAMVLAVLVLGLPKDQQKKALRYGIIGAFAFRTVAVLLAVYLIQLEWVKLGGAAYLLYLSYYHFFGGNPGSADRDVPRAKGAFGLSPFWATVVKVELTDIVFALDSILVAVAMSPKRWVILTGGLLGIIMMRMVIGRLLSRYSADFIDSSTTSFHWASWFYSPLVEETTLLSRNGWPPALLAGVAAVDNELGPRDERSIVRK